MKAYNIYGKAIELTDIELRVLYNLNQYCHPFSCYNEELGKWIDYNSTYYMTDSFWLYIRSLINKEEYIKAFKHLLINGIIEKIYSGVDEKKFLYRTIFGYSAKEPYKKENNKPYKKTKTTSYFYKLYHLKQKEKESYNEWMNNHSGK